MRTQIETDAQDMSQAKKDRDAYFLAMIKGDSDKCHDIEERYELYGYPPEVVTIGLNAAAKGEDLMLAVVRYVYGEDNPILEHIL